jgi:hypothetical protein
VEYPADETVVLLEENPGGVERIKRAVADQAAREKAKEERRG